MTAFEPAGDRPRWAEALELLRDASVGDVVTYAMLADALGSSQRSVLQAAARKAGEALLTEDHRAIEAVARVGYRIVEASEHVRLARGQQKRSSRALVKAHRAVTHVDMAGMSVESRRLVETAAMALSQQMEYLRRLDIRQRNLGDALASVSRRQERSEEEAASIRERLARLERRAAS